MEEEDFRTFQQGPLFMGALAAGLLIGAAALLWLLDLPGWVGGQVTEAVGEARSLHRSFDEEVLQYSPFRELHREALPAYAAALAQSGAPGEDARVDEALERAQRLSRDEELAKILEGLHGALIEGHGDLSSWERAWNQRLAALGEPYGIVGGFLETGHDHDDEHEHGDHGDHDGEHAGSDQGKRHRGTYMPETHEIHGEVTVRIDGESYPVQWRGRLDRFRRAGEPTFYHPRLEESWVRTDRAWATLWGAMARAVLLAEDFEGAEEEIRFGWREELREEIREVLGEEDFQVLLRGAVRQMELRKIAADVSLRGRRCGQRFRIARIPWLGFDSQELEQMGRMARADRFENCPRLTEEEAAEIRRLSRELQADSAYQEVMPRLLARFLEQKTYMAAAFAHRAKDAESLEGFSVLESAEIGGYLTGTLRGPYPRMGLFKLCFDHRYGSARSYRGWLELLREQGFRCRGELPAELLERLQEVEENRFGRVEEIEIQGEAPERAPLSRRD